MNDPTHSSAAERLIALGEIVGTHGVRGLLRFHSYSHPANAPPIGRPLHLTPRPAPGAQSVSSIQDAPSLTLDSARPHGNVMLLHAVGVDSIEAAEVLVGHALASPESELPAPAPGEFYVYQLEGLDVLTSAGDRIGTIDRSFSTGANEVLVVRDGEREYLIPVIADVIRTIDVSAGRVVIEPMAGLLDP